MAVELHTNSACMVVCPMQYEFCRGDQSVTALFLNAGQSAQKFIGDVLAQPCGAKVTTGKFQDFRLADGGPVYRVASCNLKNNLRLVVYFSEVVRYPLYLQPPAVWRYHSPTGEIVERGAPQHGLFTAGVHGDIAANGAGILRGRINCKHQICRSGGFGYTTGDHPCAAAYGCHRLFNARQLPGQHSANMVELFSVDNSGVSVQWYGTTGVASAAATGNNRQPGGDALSYNVLHLYFIVGRYHDQWILHPPIGRIGDVGHTGQATKVYVARGGHLEQTFFNLLA